MIYVFDEENIGLVIELKKKHIFIMTQCLRHNADMHMLTHKLFHLCFNVTLPGYIPNNVSSQENPYFMVLIIILALSTEHIK